LAPGDRCRVPPRRGGRARAPHLRALRAGRHALLGRGQAAPTADPSAPRVRGGSDALRDHGPVHGLRGVSQLDDRGRGFRLEAFGLQSRSTATPPATSVCGSIEPSTWRRRRAARAVAAKTTTNTAAATRTIV